jgi:hypothetical protein
VSGTGAVARVLLDAGAPWTAIPVTGDAADRGGQLGDAEVARVLIEAGADLDATAAATAGGVPGGTALLHAAAPRSRRPWFVLGSTGEKRALHAAQSG